MNNELHVKALVIQKEIEAMKVPVHLKMLPEVGRILALVKGVSGLLVEITEKIGEDDGGS